MDLLKKLWIALLLITFSANAQFIITGGASSGATGGSTYQLASTTAAITSAGAGAVIEIQGDVILSANFTPPAGQKWIQSKGTINYGAFTLTLNDTELVSNSDEPFIFGTTGSLAGTARMSEVIYARAFGVKNDGQEFKTASITSGTNVLNVTGANFTSADIGKFVSIKGAVAGYADSPTGQKALNSTITGVNSSTQVTIADNAGATATNQLVWYGTDNRNALEQITFLQNQNEGTTVRFSGGRVFTSVSDATTTSGLTDSFNNLTIGEGADNLAWDLGGATITAIPHNFQFSILLNISNTHNFRMYNGVLQQDRQLHNYSGLAVGGTGDDFNTVVRIRAGCYNTILEHLDLTETAGTIASTTGTLQFTNYIKGTAASGYPGASEMVYGTVDEVTGALTPDANADFAYSSTLLDIGTAVFETTRINNPDRTGLRHYSFSGSSFAGWSGLTTSRYKAFYYGAGGEGDFLYASGEQSFYNIYKYKDDVKFIRVQVERPTDLTVIDAQVRAPLNSIGLTLNSVRVSDGLAHGLANMCSDFVMNGGEIVNTGNVLPAFSNNTEDMRWATQNQQFNNVKFEDGFTGYLNFVGTHNVKIHGNTLLGTSFVDRLNTNLPAGLSLDDARGAMAYYNFLERVSVDLDRGNVLSNNTGHQVDLRITAGGVYVHNNNLWNSTITNNPRTADRNVSIFRDNVMRFDKSMNGGIVLDPNNNLIIENLIMIFNDKTLVNSNITETDTYEPMLFGENGNNLWKATSTQTFDYGGYIDGLEIIGAESAPSVKDSFSADFPVIDAKDVKSSIALYLRDGLPRDYLYENISAPFLRLQLDQFESTIISATPTITFKNLNLEVDASYPWTSTSSYVFRTPVRNVNIEVDGGKFSVLQTFTTTGGNPTKFVKIDHLGTTVFKDVEFYSESAVTWDFSNTANVSASSGAITFIDPDFDVDDDGVLEVTVTNLRAGDKILFTKPGPGIESYANDTAAIAGGIPSTGKYVYIDSDTGSLVVCGLNP